MSPQAPSATLIAVLALLTAVTPFSIDMYLSAFPDMAVEFGTSASTIQLTLTAFLVGLASGNLIIGPLSDQFGRRRPLLIGTIVCCAASVLCIFAPSIHVLIGLRLVQGFAGAAGVVLARAIIADIAQGAAAARLFAVMMVIGVLAPITAPVLGGFVVAGWGWRAVFGVLAAMNLLMLAGAVFFTRETLPVERRRPGGLRSLGGGMRLVLGNRRYLGYTLVMGMAAAAMFAYISASPFVVQNILGFTPRQYSLTFGGCALAIAASGVISARLVKTVPPRTLLTGGVIGMVVVSTAQLINVTVLHVVPWLTIALMASFMAGLGFTYSNATTLAIEQAREAAGTGSAVMGFLQYIIGSSTTPLVGLAGDASAVPMAVVMFTAMVLGAAALFTLARAPKTASAPAELVPAGR
jgi:DHA1 family bicyclomycin/chloramphenicol resistance-like MFS transporter